MDAIYLGYLPYQPSAEEEYVSNSIRNIKGKAIIADLNRFLDYGKECLDELDFLANTNKYNTHILKSDKDDINKLKQALNIIKSVEGPGGGKPPRNNNSWWQKIRETVKSFCISIISLLKRMLYAVGRFTIRLVLEAWIGFWQGFGEKF